MDGFENGEASRLLCDLRSIKVQLDFVHNDAKALGLTLAARLIGAASLAIADEIEEYRVNTVKLSDHNGGIVFKEDAPRREALPSVQAAPQMAPRAAKGENAVQPLWMAEKQIIEAAIEACDGNIKRTARLLQIDPSTIYRKRAGWDRQVREKSTILSSDEVRPAYHNRNPNGTIKLIR